jgi:hypothetical protein
VGEFKARLVGVKTRFHNPKKVYGANGAREQVFSEGLMGLHNKIFNGDPVPYFSVILTQIR